MIRISKAAVVGAAKSRPAGYVDDVVAASIRQDDEWYYMAIPKYRELLRKYSGHGDAFPDGPGTALKSLLAKFGIHASPVCKCSAMAVQMNLWGADGCLEHIEEIVDVLEEEAGKRSLPFLRSLGRLLVRRAVRNSRGQ